MFSNFKSKQKIRFCYNCLFYLNLIINYLILIGSSVAKNRASVSTTASLTSPSLKWNVDDIGLLNSNKTIKKKLDFESISLHSTSPQKDADLHHDNINVDNFSIHYSKIIYFDYYKNYIIYYLTYLHIITLLKSIST